MGYILLRLHVVICVFLFKDTWSSWPNSLAPSSPMVLYPRSSPMTNVLLLNVLYNISASYMYMWIKWKLTILLLGVSVEVQMLKLYEHQTLHQAGKWLHIYKLRKINSGLKWFSDYIQKCSWKNVPLLTLVIASLVKPIERNLLSADTS